MEDRKGEQCYVKCKLRIVVNIPDSQPSDK